MKPKDEPNYEKLLPMPFGSFSYYTREWDIEFGVKCVLSERAPAPSWMHCIDKSRRSVLYYRDGRDRVDFANACARAHGLDIPLLTEEDLAPCNRQVFLEWMGSYFDQVRARYVIMGADTSTTNGDE